MRQGGHGGDSAAGASQGLTRPGRCPSHHHRKFPLLYIQKLVHINLTNYRLGSAIITTKQSMAEEKTKRNPKTSCQIGKGEPELAQKSDDTLSSPLLLTPPCSLPTSRSMEICLSTALPKPALVLVIHIPPLKDTPKWVYSELSSHAVP